MFERLNEQNQQNYDQIIRKRISEFKFNDKELERVIDCVINIFNNDKENGSVVSKSLESILGDKNFGLIKSDEIKLMQQFSFELLIVLTKEVNNNQFNDIIMNLKEKQVNQEIISYIEKLRDKQIIAETILYFSLNILSIIGAYLFYYTDYHKMEFIPIYTQTIVIVASLRLNKEYAIKSGLILSMLNFTLIFPFKDMIFTFDYQLTAFLFIEFLLLGLIVAILPNYLNQLLRFKIKTVYRLYLVSFISALLFTIILMLGNIHYTISNHLFYQFNPFYKFLEVIFISIISIQVIDILDRNKLNNPF